MYLRILKTLLFLCLPFTAVQAESLSYSGRLVNANGSAVTGPVHLKFDLAYTNNLSTILCTHDNPGVDLINGVFHAKLDFVCPLSNLKRVLEEIPTNNSIAIRVTDLTQTPNKIYSFQALHSVPNSIMAEISKQLVQMGANDGQVLTWRGSEWVAEDPASTTNGTVTSLTAADGLYGGTITDSGIIGLADGGVTSEKINQMSATLGQVLKWTSGGWAPDSDNDTPAPAESDPNVLKFARSDMMAMPIPNCSADEKLEYAPGLQTFVCASIVVVEDTLNDTETALAPSQNAVFDALTLKQDKITASTNLALKSVILTNADLTWVGLQAPAGSGNFSFTLPSSPGTAGQFLKANGAGILVWDTPSVGSSNIEPNSINDSHVSSLSTSKITGLDGQLSSINTSLATIEDTVRNTDLLGFNPASGSVTASDTVKTSLEKIVGNANALSGTVSTLAANQNNYLEKGGGSMTGNLAMSGKFITDLGAPSADGDAATKKYVDDEILLNSHWAKIGGEISYLAGPVSVGDKLRLKSTNTNYVELKSPAALGSTITFTLPGSYGSNNQFLKTDALGNLSWADVTSGTITGVTTTSPLAGSGTSGSVALSLNYDNTTIGLTGANLSVKDGGITDSKINGAANIAWSKINKTGALASEIGAVPTARQITTSTGLLGGGNLSADRTLSVNVGTNAGQIVQVDTDGKLPIIDGSKLTNFTWSQILPGTLPLISAGAGLTTTGSLASGQTLNVDVGTAAGKIVQVQTGGKLPSLDGSQLTNLGTNLGKWSDGVGGIYYSSGNVGIGTNTPNSSLSVNGTGIIVDSGTNLSYGSAIKFMNTTNKHYTLGSKGTNFVIADTSLSGTTVWQTTPLDRFVINSIGDIGVGTNNPLSKLHISAAANGSSGGLFIDAKTRDAAENNVPLIKVDAGISGGNQTALWLNTTGRLGIGTTNPTEKLHVEGRSLFTQAALFKGQTDNADGINRDTLWNYDDKVAMVVSPAADDGAVAILFPSIGNPGSDFAYIAYDEDYGEAGVAVGENGVLLLGSENDGGGSSDHVRVKSRLVVEADQASSDPIAAFQVKSGNVTSDLFRVERGGNVGIGTVAPSSKLTVTEPAGSSVISIERPAGQFGLMKYSTGTSRRWEMGVNSTLEIGANEGSDFGLWSYADNGTQSYAMMVKRSNGFVGIGVPSPKTKLNVDGAIAATGWVGAGCEDACSDIPSGYAILYADGRGVSTQGWLTASDIRLKENFQPLENNLDKILKIRGFSYNYKEQSRDKKQIGVIAQEVQEVYPEVISENNEGILAVDYPRLVAPIIEAIRELYQKHFVKHDLKIKETERRIASIEEENNRIKKEQLRLQEENELLKKRLDQIEKRLEK